MAATNQQLVALAPYVAGARADERGEMDIFCPLHNDARRSASLNVRMGVWYCHAGCGGGSLRQLVDAEDAWVSMDGRDHGVSRPSAPQVNSNGIRPTLDYVRKWHNALMANEDRLAWLEERRGIQVATALRARIGWHDYRNLYVIPVFSPERELWNVRYYDPDPRPGRRKIWSFKGMGSPPRLYPIGVLQRSMPGDSILFGEGEWDALLAIQTGALAVTRTSAAKSRWRDEWTHYFAGRHVYLCHDADRPGQQGNARVAEGLTAVAASVHYCKLPYPVEPKHGKDLTDAVLEYGPEVVWTLMANASEGA